MEVPGSHEVREVVLFYEMLGTATLIFAVNLGGGYFTPLAVGLTLFSNIAFFGSVSGGHFNPAVTAAVMVRLGLKNFASNLFYGLMIIMAQLLGATIGVVLVFISSNVDAKSQTIDPAITLLCPTRQFGELDVLCSGEGIQGQVFLMEAAVTFTFVSVILAFKFDGASDDHIVAAKSIAVTLVCMILISAKVSGGCLNPAIGIIQTCF